MTSVVEEFMSSTVPFIPITPKEKLDKDFHNLLHKTFDFESLSLAGTLVSKKYFLKHRLEVSQKRSISDIYTDVKAKERIIEKVLKFYKVITHRSILGILCWGYGIASQFRPVVVKCLYEKFNATHVLDPCAGWGDRLTAALATSTVQRYVGIDSNIDMKDSYEQIVNDYNVHNQTIDMIYQPCEHVDFSTLGMYNFVFTSPPYFTLEKYRNMPEYDSYGHWVATFLKPMLENSYKYLEIGGHICINVSGEQLCADVCSILHDQGATQLETLKYMIRNRNTKVSASRYEPIFVFHKSSSHSSEGT